MLVDLHGQHAHQSLARRRAQRALLDAFGGFTTLAREVARRVARRGATPSQRRDAAATRRRGDVPPSARRSRERQRELAALGVGADEWADASLRRSRGSRNAAALIEAATQGESALTEGDDALVATACRSSCSSLRAGERARSRAERRRRRCSSRRAIQLDEAARALRDYLRRLDLDPAELARVEARLAAIHDIARKHRVRPEALPRSRDETARASPTLAERPTPARWRAACDRRAARATTRWRADAVGKAHVRRARARASRHRGDAGARDGGRPLRDRARAARPSRRAIGLESVEFASRRIPKQPLGPLSRVASGGELSRIALAIQVVASEVGNVPTLVFDEVDTGIGGAVAATVGRLLQTLGRTAAGAVRHAPAAGRGVRRRALPRREDRRSRARCRASSRSWRRDARVEELARMLAGSEITAKTRAHASELLRAAPPQGRAR